MCLKSGMRRTQPLLAIFRVGDLLQLMTSMRPHSETGPTSFEIKDLPSFFFNNVTRTFTKLLGAHSELTGSTSFEITDLPDLFNETQTFSKI